jgi:hypothetical protein
MTNEATYTQGPWHWTFFGTAGRWALVNYAGELVHVGGPPDAPLSPDQVLIAAAPELRDALEDAVRRLDELARLLAFGLDDEDMEQSAYELTYSGKQVMALAKACGESQ